MGDCFAFFVGFGFGEGVTTHTAMDDQLWSDAVAFTRDRSPGSFDQWFSGIQFDGLTDGVLGLRARNDFVREWVDQHFLPTITDFIRSKTGWSVQVAWTVGGDVERPVSEPSQDAAQSAARPVRPKTCPSVIKHRNLVIWRALRRRPSKG